MNPSLIKEREAFLKRAMTIPVVEKPKSNFSGTSEEKGAMTSVHRRGPPSVSTVSELRSLELKPQLQGKFAVLSRIVKYMKVCHVPYAIISHSNAI